MYTDGDVWYSCPTLTHRTPTIYYRILVVGGGGGVGQTGGRTDVGAPHATRRDRNDPSEIVINAESTL